LVPNSAGRVALRIPAAKQKALAMRGLLAKKQYR